MSVRNLIARSALVNQLQTSKNVSKSTSFSVTWVDDRCRDLSNDTFVVHIRRVFTSYDCINLWNVRKHFRLSVTRWNKSTRFTTPPRHTTQQRSDCLHIISYLKRSFHDILLPRNKPVPVSSLLLHCTMCELCTYHCVSETKFLWLTVAEEQTTFGFVVFVALDQVRIVYRSFCI